MAKNIEKARTIVKRDRHEKFRGLTKKRIIEDSLDYEEEFSDEEDDNEFYIKPDNTLIFFFDILLFLVLFITF